MNILQIVEIQQKYLKGQITADQLPNSDQIDKAIENYQQMRFACDFAYSYIDGNEHRRSKVVMLSKLHIAIESNKHIKRTNQITGGNSK